MPVPSPVIEIARFCWKWQWTQLMNGLAPADKQGNYIRPASQHQTAEFPSYLANSSKSNKHKPILIIGKSCPWAHRTWLVYKLRRLENELNLFIAKPSPSKGKWELVNGLLGCKYLDELYSICGTPPNFRSTVPVLINPIDKIVKKPKIICNESTQLINILNKWPTSNNDTIDLFPEELIDKINNWENLLQSTVNDGVYKCGFARNQFAYKKASDLLFKSLNKIELSLASDSPWLCGNELTLADIRLFPTLIRWESVYVTLFGCSAKPLWSFPNIWSWRQRLFNLPNVADTCDSETWRQDYFGNLFPLRPGGIIPEGASLRDIVNAKPPII